MTPTIHNRALKGEIAKTVLMPGDPLRAKFIAENFLSSPRLVNDVRCAYAYTGLWKGEEVSVMASGMGAGSMGLYSHELYDDYEVDRIIRIGSAGALQPGLRLGDIVVALSASTDSGYALRYGLTGAYAPTVSGSLLKLLMKQTQDDSRVRYGSVFSAAAFHYSKEFMEKWASMGILCIEMETAALYSNAAELGKEALAMFTISDIIATGEACTSKERETSFTGMMEIALDLAVTA